MALEVSIVPKFPLTSIITIFIFYIVFHIIIGLVQKNLNEEIENIKNQEGFKYNDIYNELNKKLKLVNILFKWFPVLGVLAVLLIFLI